MIKPRVIIADEDESYIVPLQLKFVKDFFNKIDLEIISDKEYFNELFSRPQNVDVLIVSDALYDSSLQKHNISNIFVMMEQLEEGGTGDLNINRMFKYTSIKEIFNEIVGKSAGALNIGIVEKKETQIILVTSASGGVGKTTVAMGISSCLAMNYKRVLYINAGRLQDFQYLLDNKTSITSSDVYSKLLSPNENIYEEIKHVIRNEIFSYLPAFKASLMSIGIDYSVFEKIALSAKKSGDFDFIVVDADSTFDENLTNLLGIANKVTIIVNQTIKSVVHTNQFVANVNGINGEKYAFVCNNFDKEKYNALIRPEISLKFNVENYIEHIPGIDSKSIPDYVKCHGIQATALLAM